MKTPDPSPEHAHPQAPSPRPHPTEGLVREPASGYGAGSGYGPVADPERAVVIRPMRRGDLAEAAHILRLAFDAVGHPLPGAPGQGDADYRSLSNWLDWEPQGVLVAELEGHLQVPVDGRAHAQVRAQASAHIPIAHSEIDSPSPAQDGNEVGGKQEEEQQQEHEHAGGTWRVERRLIGSIVVYQWGSVGLVGGLSVHPAYWRCGVGGRLLAQGLRVLDGWGCTHTEVHTFAHSPRHHAFFGRHGFRPRGLHRLYTRAVRAATPPPARARLSTLLAGKRWLAIAEINQLCELLHPGLRLHTEAQDRHPPEAEVVVLRRGSLLEGFALCDVREPAPSVAASAPRTCHLRIAAVRPGAEAARSLQDLLNLCDTFAFSQGCSRLTAGVGGSQVLATRLLEADGWSPAEEMLRLARPDQDGFSQEGSLVLSTWK